MNTMKNWERARRQLLRTLGVGAAALPLLWQSRARAAGPSKRLLCVAHTGGFRQAQWSPKPGSLAGQVVPSSASPLQPHQADLIFLPRLENPNHKGTGPGAYGTLFYGLPARTDTVFPEPLGPTLDQVVAAGIPRAPGARKSLHLHVQIDRPPQVSTLPGAHRCFFAGPGQPINPVGDPLVVYKDLFAGLPALPPADLKRLLLEKRSILDYVGGGLERWRQQVGSDDRPQVQAHLQALRDLEGQLTAIEGGATAPGPSCAGTRPSPLDVNAATAFAAVLDAHLEILVAAFRCGVTQVATLQLSDATGANVNLGSFIPSVPNTPSPPSATPPLTWATVSNKPVFSGLDVKAQLDQWLMDRFEHLIRRMKSVPEPTGTLLDSTVVMWGSNMHDVGSDGTRVPFLLAGSAGSSLATGQCLLDVSGTPPTLASLHATIAATMGVPGTPFGPTTIAALRR